MTEQFYIGDLKAETIHGTQANSTYLIIGKRETLRIGVRPLMWVEPWLVSEDASVLALMAGARLRVVEQEGENGADDLLQVNSIFFPGFIIKGGHASQVCGGPILQMPDSNQGINEAFIKREVPWMVAKQLDAKLEGCGAERTLPATAVAEWLHKEYRDFLPEVVETDDVLPSTLTLAFALDSD